jgi:uncharacterized protein (TIGR00255 family)
MIFSGDMMKSMTGYGRAVYQDDKLSLETEIRSLNSRFLELKISLPRELYFMEAQLSKIIKKRITRGKVNVYINYQDKSIPQLELDENKLQAYWLMHQEAKKLVASQQEIPLSQIIYNNEIIHAKQADLAETDLVNLIEKNLHEALDNHAEMASTEGNSMRQFFINSLAIMSNELDLIEAAIPPYKQEIFERLKSNAEHLLQDAIEREDYKRLLQETALAVEKADVTEEVVRLRDHIDKFGKMINQSTVSGKSLAFVNQEMHREINTTGSKFSTTKVFPHILIVKEEVEKCKEMIANVC